MSRWARNVDANQSRIVKHLRDRGATVLLTHTLGGDFPDAVVGHAGRTYLVEIKNPDAVKRVARLSEGQKRLQDTWRGGPIRTVYTTDDVDAMLQEKV